MGLITLDIAAQVNQPPSSSGWLSLALAYNQLYVFTLANFTTETTPPYADPESDILESIRVTSLPNQGVLTLSAVPINVNDVITAAQLTGGLFKYQADAGDTDGYSDSIMTFTVSDVGSSTFTTSPKIVTFVVATNDNQAPDTVGDGEANITLGDTYVFTRASLTSQLNPPFSDPEMDAADKLLVVAVPSFGELRLSGSLVVDGQEINFTDIDAGNLTYVSEEFPNGNIEGFIFRVSDVGSGEYVG